MAFLLVAITTLPGFALMETGLAYALVGSCGGILLSLWALRRAGWVGDKYRILRVVWDSEGRWWLARVSSDPVPVRLGRDSVVFNFALLLKFHDGRRRFAVLLLRRDLPEFAFHQWLVRLKLAGLGSTTQEQEIPQRDMIHFLQNFRTALANFSKHRRSTKAPTGFALPRVTQVDETRRL